MRWLVVISIIAALTLSVIPLPFEWRWWRPEFVALIVIYWSMYAPQYFGVLVVWVCGLLLDIVELSPLGYNALGLLIIAYISYLSYQRICNYTVWQQSVWVFVLVGIYQLFCNWIGGLMDKSVESPIFLIAAVMSAIVWPLLVNLMAFLRFRLRLL